MNSNHSVRVVGPGRAGGALSSALTKVGWTVLAPVRHGDALADAAKDVDLLLLATPDGVIGEVAASITPVETTVVAHLSGARGLDVLATHPLRAALHPLTSMPTADVGAERLARGAWFALDASSDEAMTTVESVVTALGGRSFVVNDEHRVAYHAAAAIASNHVVALLGRPNESPPRRACRLRRISNLFVPRSTTLKTSAWPMPSLVLWRGATGRRLLVIEKTSTRRNSRCTTHWSKPLNAWWTLEPQLPTPQTTQTPERNLDAGPFYKG